MSFWYGLGFDDISNMPFAAIEAYLQRLPARQAELRLMVADAASIPHMKPEARRSVMRAWERIAEEFGGATARPASAGRLKLMGIGVRYVN